MPNYYAQVDSNRMCVAVLDMGDEYTNRLYYPIDTYDLSLIGKQLDFGLVPGDVIDGNNTTTPDTTLITTDNSSSSSNRCLVFPETLVLTYNLNLKGNRMQTYNTDDWSFWQYFAYGGTYEYWDATTKYFTDNTSNQTVIDIDGQGVLTNIICPVPKSWDSTVTVTITVDGEEHIFVSRSNNTQSRYCLGYLAPEYDSSDDDDDQIRYPSSNWKEDDREMYILIPPTALTRGNAGIKFDTGIQVNIKSNSGWQTGTDSIGGASYLTYVPFGL